jgi:steroid delta-isomerase-like uncharacterized protein
MSENRKAVVRRWFEEVWNKQRIEAVDEMLAPGGIIYGMGQEFDRISFRTLHSSFLGAFPDLHFQIEDVVAEGDKVMCRWVATGTHRGDGLNVPATQRVARIEGMSIVEFGPDDMVVRAWNNYDVFGMMQQIGAIP